ncbi:MAG TPA: cyclic 2,3-diphosphoglycerate synthase [Thermoplasmata archaeon]|nr:cyclic 2,3-diphosphoglycerate synthase [Thermoplasmata archaeon]
MAEPRKVMILGAAGRDFHNFNVYFRDKPEYRVVGFTATQIPGIETRRYPSSLAGRYYPDGIPTYPEADLPDLLSRLGVDLVVFSYSDVDYAHVGHLAAIANAHGADFMLLGAQQTMLQAKVPVVAVCAVRTGSGKSQTSRRLAGILRAHGKKVVVVRHPMPYGDLASQAVERFATYADLDKYECTIEEREEYEPHIDKGTVVYAGVDYERILRQAEQEAEILLWDGGNNDTPFFRPDLHLVVADPHRPGHELTYYPGETNLRMADVVVINKVDTAKPEDVETVRANIRAVNPGAVVVEAASPITAVDDAPVRGKRALVIEDGPTLTHGGMTYGAGYIAAQRFGASEIVDPRPYAVGSIKETFRKYPNASRVLPAMGYGPKQIKELDATIDAVPCDVVVSGTPIDLGRLLTPNKPIVQVRYELDEIGHPNLEDVLREWDLI